MSNTMQNLHDVGINPFAVQLLAESMLKSSYVSHKGIEPLTFEFPVRRSDCAGWAGVRITIEAVPMPDALPKHDQVVAPHTAKVLTDAARDVLTERRRQIEKEGWTPEHDDEHAGGSLAQAAACYALHAAGRDAWDAQSYQAASPPMDGPSDEDTLWPWGRESWKPKNQRADLVRAGALILAEIERRDRAAIAIGPGCDAGGEA